MAQEENAVSFPLRSKRIIPDAEWKRKSLEFDWADIIALDERFVAIEGEIEQIEPHGVYCRVGDRFSRWKPRLLAVLWEHPELNRPMVYRVAAKFLQLIMPPCQGCGHDGAACVGLEMQTACDLGGSEPMQHPK
jgi:hypothetical protein